MRFAPPRLRPALVAFATILVTPPPVEAGGPFRRRVETARPTTVVVRPDNVNASTPMLGTFYATPYMNVRGNNPTGGGYSPMGQYGVSNFAIYGPLSAYRSTSAPVAVYSRGYDGSLILTEGTAFSSPNLPEASPVVYPTPTSYRDRPRTSAPRSLPSAINWIDQN